LKVSGSGVFSPRISSGGDGIGTRGVLGISPADEPQGEGLCSRAAGHIIGSQSVFVAMGTYGFMVRWCSVFFSGVRFGDAGGWTRAAASSSQNILGMGV
jgi:hypothetical protein